LRPDEPRRALGVFFSKGDGIMPVPGPPIPADLISTTEARALLGVTRDTLYHWIHSGKLPAWKRCGRLLVSRAGLTALYQPVPVRPPLDFPTPSEWRERERIKAALDKGSNGKPA
jgi:excisionase family DNA binding protein